MWGVDASGLNPFGIREDGRVPVPSDACHFAEAQESFRRFGGAELPAGVVQH